MKPLVLGNLSYGMYAIGVKDGNRPNACIVNTVMQISKATPSDQPLVALAMNRDNYSCECIEKEGIFSISVGGHACHGDRCAGVCVGPSRGQAGERPAQGAH